MRTLLFGASGQVGREILRRAGALTIIAAPRDEGDLGVPGAAAALIERSRCDAVVNAAAYTAVDRAERERDLAFRINAAAPGEMAAAAARRGAPFLHFSTDYVFDGAASRPYRETDAPAPATAYGASKLAGEAAVAAAGGAPAIIRTSWVFSAHGSNFVKTMLRLARERGAVRVVADQTGKPTPAAALADAALVLAAGLLRAPEKSGLYHFAGDEPASWADFAQSIFKAAGVSAPVERIATRDYPTPARRPLYSVLDTTKISQAFGLAAPSWRAALGDVVRELRQGDGA